VSRPQNYLYWIELAVEFGGTRLRRGDALGRNPIDLFVDETIGNTVQDFEIDAAANHIYWSFDDMGIPKLQRRGLNAENPVNLATAADGVYGGVELDLVHQQVYWTSSNFPANEFLIQRVNFDGSGIETLRNNAGLVSSLTLDVPRGKMYWVDQQGSPGIEYLRRSNLDGSGYETLGVFGPFPLAIDSARNSMYAAYYGGDDVSHVALGSVVRTTMFDRTDGVYGPLDIDVDPQRQKLFWANNLGGTIQMSGLLGNAGKPVTLVSGLHGVKLLAVGPVPEPTAAVLAAIAFGAVAGARRTFAKAATATMQAGSLPRIAPSSAI
jgi:hypothetical protein